MLQERRITHVDLFPSQHRRDRDEHGEFFGGTAKVVGHRDHGLVVVSHHHDLGGLVEQLGVGLRHTKKPQKAKAEPLQSIRPVIQIEATTSV